MKSSRFISTSIGFVFTAAVVGVIGGCSSSGPTRVDYLSAFGDGGTTRYVCSGTATACADRDLAVCTGGAAGHCFLLGSCQGTPTPCSALVAADTCTAQIGCAWDASFNLCTGVAQACGGRSYAFCGSSAGCGWSGGGCTGVVADCPTLSDSCALQPGCIWAPAP